MVGLVGKGTDVGEDVKEGSSVSSGKEGAMPISIYEHQESFVPVIRTRSLENRFGASHFRQGTPSFDMVSSLGEVITMLRQTYRRAGLLEHGTRERGSGNYRLRAMFRSRIPSSLAGSISARLKLPLYGRPEELMFVCHKGRPEVNHRVHVVVYVDRGIGEGHRPVWGGSARLVMTKDFMEKQEKIPQQPIRSRMIHRLYQTQHRNSQQRSWM
jgi:hypothetical protein